MAALRSVVNGPTVTFGADSHRVKAVRVLVAEDLCKFTDLSSCFQTSGHVWLRDSERSAKTNPSKIAGRIHGRQNANCLQKTAGKRQKTLLTAKQMVSV